MKKWLKVLLIILGVFVIVVIGILYYAISAIDTTPYFETEYYSNTIEKLNKNILERPKSEGELLAGFARVNITPTIVQGKQNPSKGEFNKIKFSGFGDGKYAAGVHDSIFLKTVVLQVENDFVILVSGDFLLSPPEVVKLVGENFKDHPSIKRERILFGATHTHASIGNCIPGIVGEKFGGEYQPEVVRWLSEKITEAIHKAFSDLKPSKLATGYFNAPTLVRNRLIGSTGRLNDKFTVSSIQQENGRSAVVGIFAAHATTIGAWNNQFSGDYPGYFQRGLESKGIDMAMFYAGTCGSHSYKSEGSKFEKSKYVGEALADSAFIVIEKLNYSNSIRFSMVASEIEIPKLQMIYISDGLRLSPEVAHKLMPEINSIYIQGLLLKDLVWITMPCELSGEYAIDLQNALELKGFNSAITSFNGQYLGYITPAKYYYYDAYESRLMGWFGPSMGDYLMELNYTIADSLSGYKL